MFLTFSILVQQSVLLSSLHRGNSIVPSDSQSTVKPSLSPSPIPSSSVRPLDEIQECEKPDTDLKPIETPNVFPDETSHSVVEISDSFYLTIRPVARKGSRTEKAIIKLANAS